MESTILTNAKLQGYRFGCAGQSEWTTSFRVHNGGGGTSNGKHTVNGRRICRFFKYNGTGEPFGIELSNRCGL